jgi:hypothetical protein
MLAVVTQREAMQVVEHLHTQLAQHVLARPRHDEEGQTGHHRADHEQDNHDHHQPRQPGGAVGLRGTEGYSYPPTENRWQ